MIPKSALEAFSRESVERLLKIGTKGNKRKRERLGDDIDLLSFQQRMLGCLSLSESMGTVLFEVGRNHMKVSTKDALGLIRKLPGYRSFVESRNLEEARLSSEIGVFQMTYQSTGEGILSLSRFEKDKLLVFRLEECADCYGIREVGRSICYYAGGLIAGALEVALGGSVGFAESKCYAKGDHFCEFRYKILKG